MTADDVEIKKSILTLSAGIRTPLQYKALVQITTRPIFQKRGSIDVVPKPETSITAGERRVCCSELENIVLVEAQGRALDLQPQRVARCNMTGGIDGKRTCNVIDVFPDAAFVTSVRNGKVVVIEAGDIVAVGS